MIKRFDVKDSTVVLDALMRAGTNDRTTAIMAASYIDRYMELVLTAMLSGANAEIRDKMFGGYGFLATTAAKIDLVTALGVINTIDRKAIIALNRVRNRFAHEIHIDSFSDPTVADLCSGIVLHETVASLGSMLEKYGHDPSVNHPKTRFVCAAINYCLFFNNWMAEYSHTGSIAGSGLLTAIGSSPETR